MARPADASSGGVAGNMLVAGSLVAASAAALLSFRIPFPAFDAALHANAGPMLAAAAAGTALGATATVRGHSARALREAYVFALSVGGSGGIAIGLKLVGGPLAASALGVVGVLVALGLVWLTDGRRRLANLGLTAVLVGLFLAAIPAYLAASTEHLGFGGVALWLLGGVAHADVLGAALALVLAVAGCAALVRSASSGGSADTAAALLAGLGIGIAGPVAFVGWAAASLTQSALGSEAPRSQAIIAAASVGAALLMVTDSIGRLLVGGYALPLNMTTAFVAIPAFLWWNRRRLRQQAATKSGRLFEAFEALVLVLLAAGLAVFGYGFTSFVRLAT